MGKNQCAFSVGRGRLRRLLNRIPPDLERQSGPFTLTDFDAERCVMIEGTRFMPTIYTALRARHRHKQVSPPVSLPTAEVFGTPADTPLLARAKQTAAPHIPRHADSQENKPNRKIIVIGAGFAGLCAAFELDGLGYEVRVYEARDRVGGRVHSLPNFVEGRVAEGGGELIGSNHPLWNSYKHHFKLEFSDVCEYGNSPFRLHGITLTFEQTKDLTDEFDEQFKLLTNLAATIVDPFEPWTNRNAEALDRIPLAKWIDQAQCTSCCKHALKIMFEADNGIPASEQSLLGILAMVKGGGLDRYWTDTELFRCRGGNQQLAEYFESSLNRHGAWKVVFRSSPVTSLAPFESRIRVRFQTQDGEACDDADDVILAVPPSVWHNINFEAFPELAKKLATPPQMGSNVKYLMQFDKRFWKDFASSPTLSEDGPVDLTWETTEEYKDANFVMVAFSGSTDADRCVAWTDQERRQQYVNALQSPYPGIGGEIQKDKFMNWPKEVWTEASYYFPRVNEVTSWGPFWRAGYEGWLHFAGEHTSYAFMGYMEGALSSGYRLAKNLAVRDKLLPA